MKKKRAVDGEKGKPRRHEVARHPRVRFQYEIFETFEAGLEVPLDSGMARWPEWTPFSYPFNLTRQPAASVPCGFTSEGLPAGLQIVGPSYADALVLRAARAYEQLQPFELPET